MKYVLDASVGLKWVLPEDGSDKALRLGLEYRNGVHELIAPDTFPPAFTSPWQSGNNVRSLRRTKELCNCFRRSQSPLI